MLVRTGDADDLVLLVVAGPAVVEEGVEGEGEVGGGEDDEEEVEQEEEGFGCDGSEAESENLLGQYGSFDRCLFLWKPELTVSTCTRPR